MGEYHTNKKQRAIENGVHLMNKNESKNPISEIKLPIIHTAKTKSWPHKRIQNLYTKAL